MPTTWRWNGRDRGTKMTVDAALRTEANREDDIGALMRRIGADAAERWVARNRQRYAEDGHGLWAIETKAEGTFAGDCGIITWAMATSSHGGGECDRPVMCTAALHSMGPTMR